MDVPTTCEEGTKLSTGIWRVNAWMVKVGEGRGENGHGGEWDKTQRRLGGTQRLQRTWLCGDRGLTAVFSLTI